MQKLRFAVPLLLVLAGCGGGSSVPASMPAPVTPPANASGVASVTISIGGKTQASTARHRAYISASMQAVSIAVNGGTAIVQGCTTSCTVTVGMPFGPDTIVVKTYDGTNLGTAKLLSTGTLSTTVTGSTTSLSIPTGAVVDAAHSTAAIVASDADVLTNATANGTMSIGGTLADADGNTIPGGTLLAPIVFDNNGSTTVTAVSTTAVASTSDTGTFTYAATANGTLRAKDLTTGTTLATLTLMPAPYFIFTLHAGTNALQVVSPTRQTAVATLPLSSVAGMAVNATATTAYVTNPTNQTVMVIDVTHKNAPAVSSTIGGFLANAAGIGIDAVHGMLYVGTGDPAHTNSGLQHVPITGGTPVTDYTTTYAGAAVVDPAGACVYGPVYGRNTLGFGDSTGFDVFETGSPGTDHGYVSANFTGGLVVTPDSQHVYTMEVPGTHVFVFDVGSHCAVSANATPNVSQGTGGNNPKAMLLNRTGTKLYIGSGGGNPNLAVFTISGGVPGSEQDFSVNNGTDSGFSLFGSAASADGKIWAFDNYTGSLHAIDASTATPTEPVWSPLNVTGSGLVIAP